MACEQHLVFLIKKNNISIYIFSWYQLVSIIQLSNVGISPNFQLLKRPPRTNASSVSASPFSDVTETRRGEAGLSVLLQDSLAARSTIGLKWHFFLGGGGGRFLVYLLLLLTHFLEMALLDNTSVKNETLIYEQLSTATGSRLTMTSTSTLCREAYYVCIVNTCSWLSKSRMIWNIFN